MCLVSFDHESRAVRVTMALFSTGALSLLESPVTNSAYSV